MAEQFGDYTLLESLGSGDMGTTYRATDNNTGEEVALKILNKVDSSNEYKRGSALEIIEFTMSMSHPRMQPITTAVEADDKLGIVTPIAANRSLADYIKTNKVPPKVGLKLVAQLASAIQYLHDQEVAHGSIKPSNILMDAEGNVSLTDLSMAHLRELGFVPEKPTKQQLFFMQPEKEYHAAPEIVGDVFSVAVLTYFLLSGKLPFNDPDPDARNPVEGGGLPPAMAAVLRKELNPQPRFRYTDLPSFMNALKDATQGKVDPETERLFGVAAPPPPPETKK